MSSKMFKQKMSCFLTLFFGIFILSIFLTPIFNLRGYTESEQVIVDLYTQKGGQGANVGGGIFGFGEGVRLMVQLDARLPQTVEEVSEFLKTQVDFEVTDPDGNLLISRSEQIDLNRRSIIAFMLPSNTKAGTYKVLAMYNYQGQTATDFLTFTVDSACSFEKITRSGRITHNETWSGIVYITGDLRIEDWATVTIEPGTTVFFAAHSDDQCSGRREQRTSKPEQRDPTYTLEYAQTHSAIQGPIVARGNKDNMVIFTSDSLNPSYADWHDLNLHKGSLFENVIVEYAQCFSIGNSHGNTEQVSQSIVRHILSAGVGINSPATVTHNFIYDCGHEGIDVSPGSGMPIIANNIVFHSAVGIFAHASQIIEYNTLIDNDRGICICGGDGVVRYNLIASPNGAPHDWNYGDFAYEAFVPHGRRPNTRGIKVRDSSPNITDNIIRRHPVNIEVFGNASLIINNNSIFNGEIGILLDEFAGTSTLYRNNIYDNTLNVQLRNSAVLIDATNNWWGTFVTSEIEEKIWDYHDDGTLGRVNYDSFEEYIINSPSTISCSPINSTISIGKMVTISGFIGPPHGGVTVTLTYTKPDATAVTRTLATNFAGHFSDTYIPDQLGSWSVKASWDRDEDHTEAVATTLLTVVEERHRRLYQSR